MQLSYLLLVSCLVALASGNRLPNSGSTPTTKCSATITAKYDDLPVRLPAAIPVPIGNYRDLKYSIILLTLGALGVPPPAGVIPASNPNTASFGPLLILSTQNVTVIDGGAGYKSFNPTRISYACFIASEETAVNVPVSCTIAFLGFKAGVRVVRQLASYEVAKGQLTKTMSVANLQGFRGVDTVKFELVVPTQLAVAVAFDDFVYTGWS